MTHEEIIAELTAPGSEFALEDVVENGVPLRIYQKAPPAFRDVLLSTRQFGDRLFLIYESEQMTFEEHFRKVAALATFLREKGVRKGDRVAIGMRNYPEWLVAFWAAQAIGAVVVALNAWWTGPELEYALADSGTSVLIVDGERMETVTPHLPALKIGSIIVARSDNVPPIAISFAQATSADVTELPDADVGPADYATILDTSGTTGRPKGAVATQRNHMTNIMNTLLNIAVGIRRAGVELPPADQRPQPSALQTFPFFHIGGLTGLYLNTLMGAKLALMYRWSAEEAVRLIEQYRIASAGGVPIVVRQMLEAGRASGRDLSSLQGISSGGAPVPPDLINQIGSQFKGNVGAANGYGLTETTSAVIVAGGQDYFDHPNSVGRPVATADIRIVDDAGRDCAEGQVGELWSRGPNVISGYWNKPEATAAAFTDGWFHTGDLGYRDKDGFYYVVDRKKDVIIRGGENIYCAEVEAAILQHPQVRDVAVLGVPDRELGEQVAAIVQPAGRVADLDDLPDDIRRFLASHLARFKIPAIIKLTDGDLPRTATGKVLKRELKTSYFDLATPAV
jgi:acyl-CoA synthetase (AMP-forming)/AMP-acid ligase II